MDVQGNRGRRLRAGRLAVRVARQASCRVGCRARQGRLWLVAVERLVITWVCLGLRGAQGRPPAANDGLSRASLVTSAAACSRPGGADGLAWRVRARATAREARGREGGEDKHDGLATSAGSFRPVVHGRLTAAAGARERGGDGGATAWWQVVESARASLRASLVASKSLRAPSSGE